MTDYVASLTEALRHKEAELAYVRQQYKGVKREVKQLRKLLKPQ